MDILVSTDWLAREKGASDLVLLDATYFALDPGRDARAEYEAAHIPGARFMDLPSLKDADNPIPFMLPSPEQFASRMRALGVSNGSRVVLYDNAPHHTATRAWWMLRSFGAHNVAVLDGGMAKWQAEGRPIETGATPEVAPGHFLSRFSAGAVRSLDQVLAGLGTGEEQLLDARGARRFTGEDSDPRPEVASGHIPGSKNLPYDRLVTENRTFRDPVSIREALVDAGIDLKRPLVTTCGSGVTAAVVLFAAVLAGKHDVALYDGSWSEWGTHPDTPKEIGPA